MRGVITKEEALEKLADKDQKIFIISGQAIGEF
jgi:hypothetical protein